MVIKRWAAIWIGVLLIAAAICLGASRSANAQEDSASAELESRIETFFLDLSDPTLEAEDVFGDFLKGGHLADRKKDIKKMAQRFESLQEKYGKFLEHEQISARPIGKKKDLVLFKYLYKTTKYPILWTFDFYSPPGSESDQDAWVVISVGFSTQLDSLNR